MLVLEVYWVLLANWKKKKAMCGALRREDGIKT